MTHYDKIAASAPVNKTAAVSTSRGSHWEPKVKLNDWYPDPLPLQGAEQGMGRSHNAEFIDFTGQVVGRLAVIGLVVKANPKRPARWLCKCKCGDYCTRTSKSLRIGMAGGNSFIPMCGRCDYQGKLSRGWSPKPKPSPTHPIAPEVRT